ncbi:MAG: hypothetical protein [Bacteriophage sp.]|nr:MAG: hypothetical protein [Bacteriophage sp.]
MQLILVTGPAHGKVIAHEGTEPPDVLRAEVATDGELGKLSIKYRLVYWDKQEAYYVPFAWRTGFALKKLLEMKAKEE